MEQRYPQLLRTVRHRWWRPVLGLLFVVAVLLSFAVVLAILALAATLATGGSRSPFSEKALDPSTPAGLLVTNIAIAMIIPVVVLAVFVVHRQRPGVLSSVSGRLRWTLLRRMLVVALAVSATSYVVTMLLPEAFGAAGERPDTATLIALLAVIALTTPLQAAAEEYGFRGYLSQAIGSWWKDPRRGAIFAAVASAALFALAHGAQDAWLFIDRLVFGLAASWLAWRTGGLEVPMALHVANNLVALTIGAFQGELKEALTSTSLDWRYAVADIVTIMLFAVLADRLARRWRVAVVSHPMPVGYPDKRLEGPAG